MLFDEPMVMHSQRDDGRHWLTTLDFPPLQILPVAANHCRVGHFLARLLSSKLAGAETIPEELTLTRADVTGRAPELEGEAGDVRVRFELRPAPPDTEGADTEDDGEDDGEDDSEDDSEDVVDFVTALPQADWPGDYDGWIEAAGRRLGLDAPPARDADAYEGEMAAAAADVQRRMPELRQRFSAGLGELRMGLKVGLPTRAGGLEFVWMSPLAWPAGGPISCRLESSPHDCKGFKEGQIVPVTESDVADYAIGSEEGGVVDPGLSNRIAENYGLIVS